MVPSQQTKVQLFESDGVFIPSRMGSFLVWRELHKGQLKPTPRNEKGLCKICDGFQIIDTVEHGTVWCLCYLNEQTEALYRALNKYESAIKPKTLEELQPIHDTLPKIREFWGIVEAVKTFIRSPTEWLTLMGPPGTGKTHMLSAIKSAFGSWALYLTASDFESLVFQSLKDDTLNDMIENIRKVPILLFDDVGSEYVKDGKDFVRSNLRKIIDYRYKLALEYPTVVATNLDVNGLKLYDQRIFDRVLDQDIVSYAWMQFPSWRTQGVIKNEGIK